MPNIILILSEDHGQDLGCYGNPEVLTPNIDFLAKNGVKFQNAYTTYSVCSPSRSSIFTGLYPHQNGQIGLATHSFRMYKTFETIPSYLKNAGYRTGCLGKIHVNPQAAIPFDYHEINASNFAKEELPQYAVKAMEFIKKDKSPFFLMVNFPDAHFPLQRQVEGMPKNPINADSVSSTLPFVAADTRRLREVTADYYNSINRLDEAIGFLLDSLENNNLMENALIIFLSDHGAQFSRGKTTNYEAGLKIPLIIKWKGKIMEGETVKDKLVSTIDLFPTIVEAVGKGNTAAPLPGRSLLSLAKGKEGDPWREHVFAGGMEGTALYFFPRRSVRGKQFKLIHNLLAGKEDPYYTVYTDHVYPTVISGTTEEEILQLDQNIQNVYHTWKNPPEFELYDLINDPWELKNLADDKDFQVELEKMKKVLADWQEETRDPLGEVLYLDSLTNEIALVNKNYPNHGYQKIPGFKWNYPEYFGEYVWKED